MARNRSEWRDDLTQRLKQAVRARGWNVNVQQLVTVELVLTLLEMVTPGQPAVAGSALLRGYRFLPVDEAGEQALRIAGWLVGDLKSEPTWREALDEYLRMPEQLRAFLLDNAEDIPKQRTPPLVADREADYADALRTLPTHRTTVMPVAEAGQQYIVTSDGGDEKITIPLSLPPLAPVPAHDVPRRPRRRPVRLTWPQLVDFAAVLDTDDVKAGRSPQHWHARIVDVTLALRAADNTFQPADEIDLGRMHHIAGMVGARKSTLMDLLAIWAGRKGHRVTILVADVVAVLTRVELYRRYQVTAAPILGASGRGRHIQQLHRPGARRVDGLASMGNAMLAWASSACALNVHRSEPRPWHLDQAPCFRLGQEQVGPRGGSQVVQHVCPLWAGCQRHEASRALVQAQVWVSTPAGLVYSRVPAPVTDVDLRYLELAWLLSDLIIVDEADQVQTQLDGMFSPSQTLTGEGNDAWLDVVDTAKNREIRGKGRGPVRDPKVARWSNLVDTADTLGTRIYHLLGTSSHLRSWVGDGYFNEWTLGVRLAARFARVPVDDADRAEGEPPYRIDETLAASWRASFAKWSLRPAGRRRIDDGRADELRQLCNESAYDSDKDMTDAIREWLAGRSDIHGLHDRDELTVLAMRLQFTLLVGMLANRVSSITGQWTEVEGPLRMRGHSSSLVHRPPVEYVAMVPDSPMGNLIGFQYQHDDEAHPDRMGSLRFFRCNGIGRWLLLNLSHLYADSDNPPVGVLMMSATSWAGSSPRYDVQVPVTGVLIAPSSETSGIADSEFHFSPQRYGDRDTTKIRVSGAPQELRAAALAALVHQLARVRDDGLGPQPSPLEQQRDVLAPNRQRIMLLVGSYDECEQVEAEVLRTRPDWIGQVIRLVPDDASYTHQWTGRTLARGSVAELRHTNAWLLIAPLLAVERGHNILNSDRVAALGAAYFLVRPHPRPDDISYHVQDINRWGVDQIAAGLPEAGAPERPIHERARIFRGVARDRWRDALAHPLMVSQMDDTEQDAFMWTQLVTIWQVIGRLVRGGQSAVVHFCDAAFDPASDTSLLTGMYRVLDRAMSGSGAHARDAYLATTLYRPLHQALRSLLEPYRAL